MVWLKPERELGLLLLALELQSVLELEPGQVL